MFGLDFWKVLREEEPNAIREIIFRICFVVIYLGDSVNIPQVWPLRNKKKPISFFHNF